MANSRSRMPTKRRKSALGMTRFPSLDLWEDPWEAGLDLRKLRAKAAPLDEAWQLASILQPSTSLPDVDPSALATFVDPLDLNDAQAAQLLQDAQLIARWYLLPKRQAHVHLGREAYLTTLRAASLRAKGLYNLLGAIARETDELIEDLSIPTSLVSDQRSLMGLADDIQRFAILGESIIARMKPRNRPTDRRRNVAITLASQAVEEATGKQIAVSRGTKARPSPHFRNEPGHFVAGFIRLLSAASEPITAGAFDKLRRVRAAKVHPAESPLVVMQESRRTLR